MIPTIQNSSNILVYKKFDIDIQMDINSEIQKRVKSTPKAKNIPQLISEDEFKSLIDKEVLHIGRVLPIWALPELLKMDISIFPRTDIYNLRGPSHIYCDVYLTGVDILSIMARELKFGEGHPLRFALIDPMDDYIFNDKCFTPDVKDIFRYYASYEHYEYLFQYQYINESFDYYSNRFDPFRSGMKYKRVTVDGMKGLDINKVLMYRITQGIDPNYNPTTDLFYKFKKRFSIDRDTKYSKDEFYYEIIEL